ncbi:MAG: hypothetical protein WBE13_11505 [Candidatus Acidiferrum sp.]
MRSQFRVVNPQKGIAEEASGIYFHFKPGLDDVQEGDIISAVLVGQDGLTDIFVEEGLTAQKEREQFESVGQPTPDPGWNPHRGTPHKIAGVPHDGRFSHPANHEEKENGNTIHRSRA